MTSQDLTDYTQDLISRLEILLDVKDLVTQTLEEVRIHIDNYNIQFGAGYIIFSIEHENVYHHLNDVQVSELYSELSQLGATCEETVTYIDTRNVLGEI